MSGAAGGAVDGGGGPGVPQRRARPARRRTRRSPVRVALRAGLASVLAGPAAGLLWWLLAPGGLRGTGDGYLDLVQAPGGIDAAFALVCLVAGGCAGLGWSLLRQETVDVAALARLAGLLVGGLVAALLAWATGWALFEVLAPGTADEASTAVGPRASPASVAGGLLWPVSLALVVVVDVVRDLAWRALTGGHPDAAPESRG